LLVGKDDELMEVRWTGVCLIWEGTEIGGVDTFHFGNSSSRPSQPSEGSITIFEPGK
jgi:hypothetical protein